MCARKVITLKWVYMVEHDAPYFAERRHEYYKSKFSFGRLLEMTLQVQILDAA